MIPFPKKALLLPAVALVAAAGLGQAQIERLTLQQMVQRTDNAIEGTIVRREVFRLDDPVENTAHYYTKLTIQGRSTFTGSPLTVEVVHGGGFLDEEEGVWNSEAPTDSETRVGKHVLAFYAWNDDLGPGLAGNALYASHGGLYRVIRARQGSIVQGRGFGYAIQSNTGLATLEKQIADELLRKDR